MKTSSISGKFWLLIGGFAILFILIQIFLNVGNLAPGSPWWETGLNVLILSVPLLLLFGSILLLVVAYQQHHRSEPLGMGMARWLYWTPRVAGILIILFISLFSLDVFGEGTGFWQTLGALFMHLLPSIGLTIVLAIAWRREWLGFWTFLGAALFFLVISIWNISMYTLGNIILFVAPLTLIAVLFRVNWDWHAEIHQARSGGSSPAPVY